MVNQTMASQCKNDMRKYLAFAKRSHDRSSRENWLKLALMMRRQAREWVVMS